MRTFSLLLVLVLSVSACDSLTSDTRPPAERTSRVRLRYELSGTYAACLVAHNDAMRQTVQQSVSPLPWQKEYTVEVSRAAPFVASIAATCADSTKTGKSNVFIFADGKLVGNSAAAGFGMTASATFTLSGQ